MPRIERSEIVRRLRANIEKKIPIVGTGAGTGISAKFEEAGGTDLIIIYNSGRYRPPLQTWHRSPCPLLSR